MLWALLVVLLALLPAAGCHLLLPYDQARAPEAGAPEAGAPDAAGADTALDILGTDIQPDGPQNPWACNAPIDSETVALYQFEDVASGLIDSTERHDGTWQGGVPNTTTGPGGCGIALLGTNGVWGKIPDDSALRLAQGSIDVWVLLPQVRPDDGNAHAVLSRDIEGNANGHLVLMWTLNQRLVARLQSDVGGTGICSDGDAPTGRWMHVGINFGPGGFELWIDGVKQAGSGTYINQKVTHDCAATSTTELGIDGNSLPWVIAANAYASQPDQILIANYFPGALDQLRISKSRRNFATFTR